jgi:glycosyltransferase involved in cell wall biosynthesis
MNSTKVPVSLIVPCKNEEANIGFCLEALAGWTNRIFVVDSGSTDRTREIAESHAVEFIHHDWPGFAKQKNWALENLEFESPWTLIVDADEVITPEFVAELRTLFTQGPELPHQAYRLNRVMNFLGRWIRHGTWYPDRVCRLFRHDTWSMPQRAVHESLEINGTTGDMNSEVPHYSYQSWNQIETRGVHYAELWAAEKRRDKKSYSPIAPFTHAIWSFFRGTILKGGLLDGLLGIRIAWENAKVVYLKYRLLRS